MKIFCKFPTINISKLNFWFVICFPKNFIWTTLKAIFSVFRIFFCIQIFKIVVSQPNIVISQPIIRWCINLNKKKWPFDMIFDINYIYPPGLHIIYHRCWLVLVAQWAAAQFDPGESTWGVFWQFWVKRAASRTSFSSSSSPPPSSGRLPHRHQKVAHREDEDVAPPCRCRLLGVYYC